MWQSLKDKLRYYVCAAGLFAVGLAVRYAGYWSDDPVSPVLLEIVPSTSPAIISQDSTHTIWEVPFVTLHAFDDAAGEFTGSSSEPHYGLSEVLIPSGRKRGSLELESAEAAPTPTTVLRSGNREFLAAGFWNYLDDRMREAAQRDVLVFVHGYNVGLHEAVCRGAQLAHDMPFSGIVIAYDWNSAGHALGYVQDTLSVPASAEQLAKFLAELRHRLDPEVRVHVLAHSMGNRVVLSAVDTLATYQPLIGASSSRSLPAGETPALLRPVYSGWEKWRPRLGESPPIAHLILAAPDVAPEAFQGSLGTVRSVVGNVTLYCSESDFALELSRYVNGQGKRGYRLGDSRHAASAMIDVIRLQGVSRSDPFGHSYYGSHPGLLTDLALLLSENRPLPERPTLKVGTWPNADQWFLR